MRCMKVVLPEPGGGLEEGEDFFWEGVHTCHTDTDNSYRLGAWGCLWCGHIQNRMCR